MPLKDQEGAQAILIERLDILNLPIAFFYALRCKGAYFTSIPSILENSATLGLLNKYGLHQLRFEDFPGSFVEVHAIATSGPNDRYFESILTPGLKDFSDYLNRVKNHPMIGVAVRRALLEVYTLNRIQNIVFLKRLAASIKEIIFLPRDNDSWHDWLPYRLGSERIRTPRIWRTLNTLRIPIDAAAAFIYTLACLAYLMVRQGLRWRRGDVQRWSAGYDVLNEGIAWKKPFHHFFAYGPRPLNPQSVLHVVRDRLQDVRTRLFFKTHRIPYVEVSRLRLPCGYFFKMLLMGYGMGFFFLAAKRPFQARRIPFLNAVAIVIYPHLIRAELLELTHQTDVFISRDEYSITHILRTMLYDLRGGKTIGYCHGDDCISVASMAYLCSHVFCFPGSFHQNLLKWNSRFSKNHAIIGAGIQGLDITFRHINRHYYPTKYRDVKARYKCIGVLASSYHANSFVTREKTYSFYQAAFDVLKQHSDLAMILRPKLNDLELSDPQFMDLFKRAGSRVFIEKELWLYDLLPVFDLVICISISTVGLESLMARIPTVYYDENEFSKHPYGQYDSGLVARSPQELARRVDEILHKNKYVDESILNSIRRDHGLLFDGKVAQRFRGVIRNTLDSVS